MFLWGFGHFVWDLVQPQTLLRMGLQWQQMRAREALAGLTILGSFESVQTIDLSFRLAVAPLLSERVSYSLASSKIFRPPDGAEDRGKPP